MFEYNFHEKASILYVVLPTQIKFDINFLNEMTKLISKASLYKCKEVRMMCSYDAQYDKMVKAYMLNVFRFILRGRDIKWNANLANIILPKIHMCDGSKFTEVDVTQMCRADELSYYRFRNNETVTKAVSEVTRLLVEKNVTLNTKEVKEFLSTTIGEIFSNCFLHSNQDEAFFMCDISYEEGEFYLWVNIIDYGTTIISNVKEHFRKNNKGLISSIQSFKWAMQEGTTTREGSGGYGLATLTEYVGKAKGELYIFSGNAFYSLIKDESYVRESSGSFLGTSVTFKVKLYQTSQFMAYDASTNKLVTIGLDDI